MMEDLPLPPGPGELIIPLPQSIPQELDLPMPLPPVLSELDLGLPPLPNLEKTVVCPECNSSIIVKDMMLRKLDCPICSSIIEM